MQRRINSRVQKHFAHQDLNRDGKLDDAELVRLHEKIAELQYCKVDQKMKSSLPSRILREMDV